MNVAPNAALATDVLSLSREADPAAVSVIVPVTERAEALVELYSEFSAAMRATGRSFEFVFVVEPKFGSLTAPLAPLAARGEPIRVLRVGQELGETSLLQVGVSHSRGRIIVTLPSYRRVEASALGRLLDAIDTGADLAVARRWPRRDSKVNQLQTRLLHIIVGRLAGRGIHDIGCGVRAMRREILERIPLYGDFARFLPALALRDGYRVTELAAAQHVGDIRTRLYRPGVYLRRLIDLLGLFFLLRFAQKPLRFFGLIGSALSLSGAAILAFLLVERLTSRGIADRPLLLLGVLLVVLGVQAIALGLIGEIIVHLHAADRPLYRVKREASG